MNLNASDLVSITNWRGNCPKPMLMMLASRLARGEQVSAQSAVELKETPRTNVVGFLVDPREG